MEVGQDLNDWDSGKQTDLFENENPEPLKRMGELTLCFFPVIKNGAILFGAEAEKCFLGIVLSRAQDR